MKKLMIAMSCLALAAPLLMSAPVSAQTAQQSKMTTCNKDAGDKKGDERKAFMKDCLSNKPAAAPTNAQQNKMTTCNKQAGDKKGDERRAFMSSCLKKDK
ncbi:PsiF family protein [Herbaspirillum sp. YR522]|uniref:PsiF family protein n=1 Tax=Herbaspirillum sp. YR522 TaxID=1144342 RepID=UPI00026F880E|nr:PsiF family protein [Herbaspirillum sp. YR522]EJN09066.1 psiF repeat containing protein [Herbaspirillum sp. YR522]